MFLFIQQKQGSVSIIRNKIITMDNIEFRSETDREPVGNSSEKSLGSEEATYIGNIVERRKKSIKSAWSGTQDETLNKLNKLVNTVSNRIIKVIKNKEKVTKYWTKR